MSCVATLYDCGEHGRLTVLQIAERTGKHPDMVRGRLRRGSSGASLFRPEVTPTLAQRRAKREAKRRAYRIAENEKRRAQRAHERAIGLTKRGRPKAKPPGLRDCAKAPQAAPSLPCESTEAFIARHPERHEVLPGFKAVPPVRIPVRHRVRGAGAA